MMHFEHMGGLLIFWAVMADLEVQDSIRSSVTADQMKLRLNATGEVVERSTIADPPNQPHAKNFGLDTARKPAGELENPAFKLLSDVLKKQKSDAEEAARKKEYEEECSMWKEKALSGGLNATDRSENYTREAVGSNTLQREKTFSLAIEMIDAETGGKFSKNLAMLEAALLQSNPGKDARQKNTSPFLTGLLVGQEVRNSTYEQHSLKANQQQHSLEDANFSLGNLSYSHPTASSRFWNLSEQGLQTAQSHPKSSKRLNKRLRLHTAINQAWGTSRPYLTT